jgi:acyl-CoA synthetase (AMP-forming)/AMP-acid ligase II
MSLTHPRDTIVSLLTALARNQPDLPLYTFLDHTANVAARLRGRDVLHGAMSVACQLQGRQVSGEPVLVLSPYGPDAVIMLLGVMLAGCQPVPVTFHQRLGMASIVKIIASTGLRVVIGRRAMLTKLKAGRVRSAPVFQAANHDLLYLAINDRQVNDRQLKKWQIADWPQPTAASTDIALIYPGMAGDDCADPRPLTHDDLLGSIDRLLQALLPPDIGDGYARSGVTQPSLLTCMDPADGMTLLLHVLLPLRAQLPSVLLPAEQALRDASVWLAALTAWRSTIVSAPPAVLALAAHDRSGGSQASTDLSALRFLCIGGDHAVPAPIQHFIEHFRHCGMSADRIFACYGMSATGRYLSGHRGFHAVQQHGIDRLSLGTPVTDDLQAMTTGDHLLVLDNELYCRGRGSHRFRMNGTEFQAEDIESVILQSFGHRGLARCAVLHLRDSRQTVVLAECATRQLADRWQGVVPAIMQQVLTATGCRLDRVMLLRPGSLPLTVSGVVCRQRCSAALNDGSLMLRLLPVRGK